MISIILGDYSIVHIKGIVYLFLYTPSKSAKPFFDSKDFSYQFIITVFCKQIYLFINPWLLR